VAHTDDDLTSIKINGLCSVNTRVIKISHGGTKVLNVPDEVPRDGAQAIRRALDVARHVAQLQRSGATLARIGKATGLHRSTAFRILRSLTDERLLHFREADHTYHIGPLAYELGLAGGIHADLHDEWKPTVRAIAAGTGLTSYLMARSGNEAVCLLCVQGTAAVRAMPFDVGQRVPLGIGAGGLVMLAALDDDEVRRIAASHSARLDVFPSRILSSTEIDRRVTETRQRGFSISLGTVAAGVSGIGVVVPDLPPHIQLALTVSCASDTIDDAEARVLASVITSALRARSAAAGAF
jgi:DNA-binding IclR family transcriptional regulator